MRRIATFLFVVIILLAPLVYGMTAAERMLSQSGGVAACTNTVKISQGLTGGDGTALGRNSALTFIPGQFTTGASGYTTIRVDIGLCKVNSPPAGAVITLYLLRDSSGAPVTTGPAATSTNTHLGSEVTSTTTSAPTVLSFTFTGLALTPNTTYYAVPGVDTLGDSTNYLMFVEGSGALSTFYSSAITGPWSTGHTGIASWIKVYDCE